MVKIDLKTTNFALKRDLHPYFSAKIAINKVKCTIFDLKIVDFALNMMNYNKILAKIAKNTAKYTIFSSKNIKTNKINKFKRQFY